MRIPAITAIFFTACDQKSTVETGTPSPDTASASDTALTCEPPSGATAVEIDATCARHGSPELTVEWSRIDIGQMLTPPVVGQLTDDNSDGQIDEDDTVDLAIVSYDNTVVALSGSDGSTLWSTTIGGLALNNQPAIGDINGDGRSEVVAIGAVGEILDYAVIALDGETGAVLWESPLGEAEFHPGFSAVGIADFEGDGLAEVYIGDTILDGTTGEIQGIGGWGKGTLICEIGLTEDRRVLSIAADADADGRLELLTGNSGYDSSGERLWIRGETDGAAAVANLDDDPELEMVVTFTPSLCENDGALVRLQDHEGWRVWELRLGDWLSTVGPPTLADVDGDGELEIALVTTTYYPDYLQRLFWTVVDLDGAVLWSTEFESDWGAPGGTGLTAFDFNQDGAAELIHQSHEAVRVIDGSTGEVLSELTGIRSMSNNSYPVVADIDDDGQAEVLVIGYPEDGTAEESGVHALGSAAGDWPDAAALWPQHGWMPEGANTFRAPPDTDPVPETDVTIELDEVCELECDEGRLLVTARVGNRGAAEIPAGTGVQLEGADGGEWFTIAQTVTTAPLASGEATESLTFTIDPDDVPSGQIRLSVDGEDLDECSTTNNTVTLEGLCR